MFVIKMKLAILVSGDNNTISRVGYVMRTLTIALFSHYDVRRF